MARNHMEKEKILRSLLGEHKQDPLILDPDDFFLLRKNGILD